MAYRRFIFKASLFLLTSTFVANANDGLSYLSWEMSGSTAINKLRKDGFQCVLEQSKHVLNYNIYHCVQKKLQSDGTVHVVKKINQDKMLVIRWCKYGHTLSEVEINESIEILLQLNF
jgi:hypothetical protein